MKPPTKMYLLRSLPGTQRDGTDAAAQRYVDTVWTRFQYGLPKKMNGYREATAQLNGPVRDTLVWSRQGLNQITTFSGFGIEGVQVDNNGIGSALFNRTPAAWVVDANAVWQHTTMYDDAAGSDKTLVFAHGGSNLTNIDSGTTSDVYYGDASSTAALVAIGGSAQVSGGIVAIPPFLILYGSDGSVTWSNENEPRNFTTGSAGSDRVTGTKIVKGLPIRGTGQSPSALLWSLDSLIKMSFVGGQAIFRFDVLSAESSILSSSSVVEYDGSFFWVGIDRFMMYSGRVQELQNTQNLNWFFDNLNYDLRQKVHVVKVPRFGEIWWFFPFGSNTECSHAVIYNVRENYWYDVELPRSSGANSQVFKYPVMADPSVNDDTYRLTVASAAGFQINEVVTGGTSGATGTVLKVLGNDIYVAIINQTLAFTNGETITGNISASSTTISAVPIEVSLHSLWIHEIGKNKSQGDNELAIPASFSFSDFGWLSGGPAGDQPIGEDKWMQLDRVEPDFNCVGTLTMEVFGQETPNSPVITSDAYPFDSTTEKIDVRKMQRIIGIRVSSNEADGDFEMGRVRIAASEGVGRS